MEPLIAAFTTLFVIVDPVGLAPLFLSCTRGMDAAARRQTALRAVLIALTVLLGAAIVGDWLLRQLGIGLPAFRIAGGLLLFSIAFEMVFERRAERRASGEQGSAGGCCFPSRSRWCSSGVPNGAHPANRALRAIARPWPPSPSPCR
jgi:small neutral amino acid transporter SnatA (MarC family)